MKMFYKRIMIQAFCVDGFGKKEKIFGTDIIVHLRKFIHFDGTGFVLGKSSKEIIKNTA